MADARVPWVLPIRQGTEIFDGSKGRTPAMVRITIGVRPNTPREMMPRLQQRAQEIIEARQSQLIAFYQVALSAHGLGIVPISARTLNLQELQARYQNQNGTEILDITIYPDLYPNPSPEKPPEGQDWEYLRISFDWEYPDPSDGGYILACYAQIENVDYVVCDLEYREDDFYGPSNAIDPAFRAGPGPKWVGNQAGNVGAKKATDIKTTILAYNNGQVSTTSNQHMHTSFVVDLRHAPRGKALKMNFYAFWSELRGGMIRPVTVSYALWKGGKMGFNQGRLYKIGDDIAPPRRDPDPIDFINTRLIDGHLVLFQNTYAAPYTDFTYLPDPAATGAPDYAAYFYYDYEVRSGVNTKFIAWIAWVPKNDGTGGHTFLPRGEFVLPTNPDYANDLIGLFTNPNPTNTRRGHLKTLDITDDQSTSSPADDYLGQHVGRITFDPGSGGAGLQGVVSFKPA